MTIKAHKQTIWMSMVVLTFFTGSIYAAGEKQHSGDQRQQLSASSSAGSRTLYSAENLIGSPVYSKKASVSASTDRNTDAANAIDQSAGTAGTYGINTDSRNTYGTDAVRGQAMQDKEKVGSVEELVIDANQDTVCYVILNANGRHCPVPWYAFDVKRSGTSKTQPLSVSDRQAQQAGTKTSENIYSATTGNKSGIGTAQPALYIKLSQEQLRQAPAIDSLSSEALSDPQLKQKVDAFYSKLPGLSSQAKGYSAQRMSQQGQRTTRGMSSTQSQGTTQDQSTAQAYRGQDQSTAQSQRGTQDRRTTAQSQRATQDIPDATGYGQAEANRQQDATSGRMATGNLVKASDIIGSDLQGAEDVDLGNISDIIIDAQQGQVAYGLITFGGFLNINQKVAAIPWSALTVTPQQKTVRIAATQDELDAVVLQDGNINQLSEAQFAQKVHSTFDTEPYWGVYGFVPGTSDTTDPNELGQTDRDTDRNRSTDRDRSTDRNRSMDRNQDTNQYRGADRDRETNQQGTEDQTHSY